MLSPGFYYMPEERWIQYYNYGKLLDQCRKNNNSKISFASELVGFTNRMATCETVELNGFRRSRVVAVSLEKYPIEPGLYGKGSPAVTNLIVSCPNLGQLEDVKKWSITISKIFPCLKYLEVNETKMIKSCKGNWIELGVHGHCLDWKWRLEDVKCSVWYSCWCSCLISLTFHELEGWTLITLTTANDQTDALFFFCILTFMFLLFSRSFVGINPCIFYRSQNLSVFGLLCQFGWHLQPMLLNFRSFFKRFIFVSFKCCHQVVIFAYNRFEHFLFVRFFIV